MHSLTNVAALENGVSWWLLNCKFSNYEFQNSSLVYSVLFLLALFRFSSDILIRWQAQETTLSLKAPTKSESCLRSTRWGSRRIFCEEYTRTVNPKADADFEKPSAIQQRAIAPIVKGRDVIAQAQSGTGKTATFSISALQTIDTAMRETQILIMSPTRELAQQIQSVVLALGDYMNVQCHACIGGTSISEDIKKLDHGQHIVSGTPGRVFDMIQRKNLRTRNIKMLILDEADEMLSKGWFLF